MIIVNLLEFGTCIFLQIMMSMKLVNGVKYIRDSEIKLYTGFSLYQRPTADSNTVWVNETE